MAEREGDEEARRKLVGNRKAEVVASGSGQRREAGRSGEQAVFGQNARWRGIVKLEWQWRGNEVSCFPVFVPSRRSAGGALGEGGAVVAEWPRIGENEGMTRKDG